MNNDIDEMLKKVEKIGNDISDIKYDLTAEKEHKLNSKYRIWQEIIIPSATPIMVAILAGVVALVQMNHADKIAISKDESSKRIADSELSTKQFELFYNDIKSKNKNQILQALDLLNIIERKSDESLSASLRAWVNTKNLNDQLLDSSEVNNSEIQAKIKEVNLLADDPKYRNNSKYRINIRYKSNEKKAKEIEYSLSKEGYQIYKVSTSGTLPNKNDIRYFHLEDIEAAKNVIKILKEDLNITLVSKKKISKNVKKGYLEIYLNI